MRELGIMAKSEWYKAASIMTTIANANRDKKTKPTPFTPDDFNPYSARKIAREPKINRAAFDMMRAAFCGDK